jgi:hypothetical protein
LAVHGAPVIHTMTGFINPHCATCGRTPMQIQRQPAAPCRRATLPFDDVPSDPPIVAPGVAQKARTAS